MDSKHVIGLYEAYLDVYEDQLDEAPYQVYGPDPHGPSDAPSKPLGKPHKDRKSARRKADKLDQEVGGYKHSVSYVPEEVDLYDLVLDHLLDEGYCDDVESAEVIMANMSEEWLDGILDEANKGEQRYLPGAKSAGARETRRNRNFSGSNSQVPEVVDQSTPGRRQLHQLARGVKKRDRAYGPGGWAASQRAEMGIST